MTLLLVRYPEEDGGYFSAAAALWAERCNATVMQSEVVSSHFSDSVKEFPTQDGCLAHAGWLWVDRFRPNVTSWPFSDEAILARAATCGHVVVPFMSCDMSWAAALQRRAISAGTDCTIATARFLADSLFLQMEEGEDHHIGLRDASGRVFPIPDSGKTAGPRRGKKLTIVVTGDERHHRHRNPATLCALGDAADHLDLTLDISFLSDKALSCHGAAACLDAASGVVLPGGDIANAATQMIIADHCLRAGIPVVGLCLGMQSMITAVVRQYPSYTGADLAERAPNAPFLSFVPISGADGSIRRRVGAQALRACASSTFGRALESAPVIRSNHRYRLNPALLPDLEQMGVKIAATDPSGDIIEAIELPAHPHFKGMQGHPECVSTAERPHPALLDFLQSTSAYAETKKATT